MTGIYPHGQDLAWIATDSMGAVAAFITAGEGPIPQSILNYPAIDIGDCEKELLALPQSSEARILASVPKPESYIDLAKRGVFVYDWNDLHRSTVARIGAYECVAIPAKSIALAALPAALQQLARLTLLPKIRFSAASTINPAQTVPCISG